MSCGGETAPTSQARDAGDARAPRDSAATPLSDARARKDAAVVATLPLGSPCTADDQCLPDGGFGQPPACLGGPFPGGYCAILSSECSGGDCPEGGVCAQLTTERLTDVDGATVGAEVSEFCARTCTKPGDCRPGYECCGACLPPPLCGIVVQP